MQTERHNRLTHSIRTIFLSLAFFVTSAGMGPAVDKASFGHSDDEGRICGNYNQLSRMSLEQINVCLQEFFEIMNEVARKFSLTFSTAENCAFRSGDAGCIGDVNEDGVVDDGDVDLVLANWGADNSLVDVSGNGLVDVDDLLLVLANFGCETDVELEGYVLVGTIQHTLSLLEIDSNGHEQSSQTLGSGDYDSINSVQKTSDEGYILTGCVEYETNQPALRCESLLLVKTNSNGNEQWSQTFGNEDFSEGNSVQQTSDGGYILTGNTRLEGEDRKGYLVKTDSNGNEQWSQAFGNYEDIYSVQQASDGGYIFSASNFLTSYLVKTDSNGNEEWSQTYRISGSFYDWLTDVKLSSDGGYLFAGTTVSFVDGWPVSAVYLVKTDSIGNKEWSQTFGNEDFARGISVQQSVDGGYVVLGEIRISGDENFKAYLVKTDSNGNEQWSQTFGGDYSYTGNSVQQTSDEGYMFLGDNEVPGSDKVSLVKTDSNGNEQWSETFGGYRGNHGHFVHQLN
jgi:hypothetical protein